jgi:two-component sensor histidine kinase
MARYFAELIDDLGASMGGDWPALMEADLAPVRMDAGRAVTVGLILTELIINAQKYAYDGGAGPIRVCLEEAPDAFRMTVEDQGRGGHSLGDGFGSLMIRSLVGQLGGDLAYSDAAPGLRAVLKAPIGD